MTSALTSTGIYTTNTSMTWLSGPGDRNADGAVHCVILANATDGFVTVGFEDLPKSNTIQVEVITDPDLLAYEHNDYDDVKVILTGGVSTTRPIQQSQTAPSPSPTPEATPTPSPTPEATLAAQSVDPTPSPSPTPKPKKDKTRPALKVPRGMTVFANAEGKYTLAYHATALDDRDGVIVPVCTPPLGTVVDIGQTWVSCTARDKAKNRTTRRFRITVRRAPKVKKTSSRRMM